MEFSRTRVTQEQKFSLLREHFEKGTPISELARINGIHPITLYKWKRLMNKNNLNQDTHVNELMSELEKLKIENKNLIKALGSLTLDNQCLKDVNDFLKKKYQKQLLEQQKNLSKKKD